MSTAPNLRPGDVVVTLEYSRGQCIPPGALCVVISAGRIVHARKIDSAVRGNFARQHLRRPTPGELAAHQLATMPPDASGCP